MPLQTRPPSSLPSRPRRRHAALHHPACAGPPRPAAATKVWRLPYWTLAASLFWKLLGHEERLKAQLLP